MGASSDRKEKPMRLAVLALVLAALAGGCGGGSDEPSAPLQSGVYEYELTQQYLLDNGISEFQAESESGTHQTTLWSSGDFVDSWRTAENRTGSCRGTYAEGDGRMVTFRWTSGCWGDWEMKYAVDARTVTWTDQKALPPYDADEDQKVTEVFSNVPWTRVGDAPKED
jgi:hypothetical protein